MLQHEHLLSLERFGSKHDLTHEIHYMPIYNERSGVEYVWSIDRSKLQFIQYRDGDAPVAALLWTIQIQGEGDGYDQTLEEERFPAYPWMGAQRLRKLLMARETLTLDPDGAEIALLAARFYFDGTRAGCEGVRQTKDYLRKVGADYGPDVFRRKIVSFAITPGQINYDGGRSFAWY